MAFTVMIFIFGGSVLIYQNFTKNKKISSTQGNDSSIPAWWYEKYFGKSVCDDEVCRPDADPDSDKLTNSQEFFYNSDPLNYRTIGDEMSDGELVAAGLDPSRKGRMTFEEVESEDNILGESLVFDKDIAKVIADSQDINKVVLPLVDDSELKINDVQTEEVYLKYFAELRSKVSKYFSDSDKAQITRILEAGGSDVEDIVNKSQRLSFELKNMEVPAMMANFHKYNIAFYKLLSEVIQEPNENNINEWYDDAQAFLVVQQKMNSEYQILAKEFGS